MVDNKLSWRDQIFRTADKAARSVAALSRLMANVGGPRSSRRTLLMSAVQSVLLYGSEVWADALNKEAYRLRLARVQRQAAFRVASAYRTVSEPAVLVIAGVIPVKLLAAERKAIYQRQGYIGKDAARTEERSRTFQSYLHLMAKTNSPDCIYCPCIPDDAEHTFFRCPQWDMLRQEAIQHLGVLSIESICETLLKGEDNWDCWSHFVRNGVFAGPAGVSGLSGSERLTSHDAAPAPTPTPTPPPPPTPPHLSSRRHPHRHPHPRR
ncbi:uncharacterized protein LOC128983977 [Macrosteles quadrilineatus]|uniref:uncharacterized protein LOC128983977 n=1 Tax=Macrosteles quadrilineatus TaxID=74068 RepID=UPI0023E2DCE9|nr:uncharacterized protein LOC128983977 [Macrosteles quadrilineatus]